jgi:peptide deformylase
MRLKIVQLGESVLREPARLLSSAEISSPETQSLIESMRETMYDAPGVGLAAPQVGVGLHIAVIEDKAEYFQDAPDDVLKERERAPVPFHVLINPKIVSRGLAQVEFFEGCLSLAGFTALVPRAREVKVECLDHRGKSKTIEARGWYARILQHEIDHLNGTVYIDRMHTRSLMALENFNRYWKNKPLEEVKQQLGRPAIAIR